MKIDNIITVSKEKAIELIKNHDSYVSQIPCCYNEKLKKYEYIEVQLINGLLEGLFYAQFGNITNRFKYKIGDKITKVGNSNVYA